MRKMYDNPTCQVIALQDEDVLTASLTLLDEGHDGDVINYNAFGGQG